MGRTWWSVPSVPQICTTEERSNIWTTLGTESQNQLLPHHKILKFSWLSYSTTRKAQQPADKPTMWIQTSSLLSPLTTWTQIMQNAPTVIAI